MSLDAYVVESRSRVEAQINSARENAEKREKTQKKAEKAVKEGKIVVRKSYPGTNWDGFIEAKAQLQKAREEKAKEAKNPTKPAKEKKEKRAREMNKGEKEAPEAPVQPKRTKREYTCGSCKGLGHNRRSCPQHPITPAVAPAAPAAVPAATTVHSEQNKKEKEKEKEKEEQPEEGQQKEGVEMNDFRVLVETVTGLAKKIQRDNFDFEKRVKELVNIQVKEAMKDMAAYMMAAYAKP